MAIIFILFVLLIVVYIASMWKIYEKAGQPGWAAVVPIYNSIILCRTAGHSGWWCLLFWLGATWILMIRDLAISFGKGLGFTLGLVHLTFIFLPLLAFGDAEYTGVPYGGRKPRSRRSVTQFD